MPTHALNVGTPSFESFSFCQLLSQIHPNDIVNSWSKCTHFCQLLPWIQFLLPTQPAKMWSFLPCSKHPRSLCGQFHNSWPFWFPDMLCLCITISSTSWTCLQLGESKSLKLPSPIQCQWWGNLTRRTPFVTCIVHPPVLHLSYNCLTIVLHLSYNCLTLVLHLSYTVHNVHVYLGGSPSAVNCIREHLL